MKIFAIAIILAFQGLVFFVLGAAASQIFAGWLELGLVIIICAVFLWAIAEALRDNSRAPDPQDWSDTQ